jgi:hypothetical protein
MEGAWVEMTHHIHQYPGAIRMLFHKVGGEGLTEAVPTHLWGQVQARLSRPLPDDMQIAPHGSVADAIAPLRQEEGRMCSSYTRIVAWANGVKMVFRTRLPEPWVPFPNRVWRRFCI